MPFEPHSIKNPQVLQIFVANTTSAPATNKLSICTGVAEFDFVATKDNAPISNSLEFAVPNGDGGLFKVEGTAIDLHATASLASMVTHSFASVLWAIDRVDAFLSDPDLGQIRLEIALTIKGSANNTHLFRVGYQLALLEGPAS